MNRIIAIIILLSAGMLDMKAQNATAALDELDVVIQQKEMYGKRVQMRIDSLKNRGGEVKGELLVDVYEQLYHAYNNYQVDSALHYVNLLQACPEVHRDNYRNTLINLSRAVTYGLMGDFCSAMAIVDTINVDDAPAELRAEYFHTCRTVYGWNAEFMRNRHESDAHLIQLTQMYRDSILLYTEPGVRRSIVLADNCIVNGDADAAINILLETIPKAEDAQKIYAYYNLAECYRCKGDEEKYALYLALTAIADIKNGVKEYIALPELANLMYKRGDVSRAYNYLLCSMDDAHFCNAFLRTIEVNDIYPIIDKEYRRQQERSRFFERSLLTGVSVLSFILILGMFYLQKQMSRMKALRQKLADANSQLRDTNVQLEDANSRLQTYNSQLTDSNQMLSTENNLLENTNKVKEEYIAHYLELCRSYMDTFESFRKSLLKLAKNNQQTELMKQLKSDEIMETEQKRFFLDFDKAFLSIHPNFITEFCKLIDEEARGQIAPKKGELLSIELRIFALVRLGVGDSAMIARFLNYSLPTIYNYRSRIRKHSSYDKEEFYQKIMEIN